MAGAAFDDVFDIIGGLGTFQIVAYIVLTFMPFWSTHALHINFLGYEMEHWCKVSELQTFSYEMQKYIAIPSQDGGYSQCEIYDLNYSTFSAEEFLSWNRSYVAEEKSKRCGEWIYDQSVFISNIVSEWNLVCENDWKIQLVSTVYYAGFLFGGFLCGMMSDRFGRMRTISFPLLIQAVSTTLGAFAPNYWVFLLARFGLGFSNAALWIVTFVYVMEMVAPVHRTWIGVVFFTIYSVGTMAHPALAYLIRDHTLFQIAVSVPPVLMFYVLWYLPESPRWLLLSGRRAEAEKVVAYIAHINRRILPDNFSLAHLYTVEEKNKKRRANVLELFRHHPLRRWTIVLCFYWFSSTLIYFALSLNAGAIAGDIFLNTFLLGSVEVPATLIGMVLMYSRVLGRKWAMCLVLLVAGVSSLLCVPLIIQNVSSEVTTPLALVGKAGATAAFSGIYVYSSEVFPTEVRTVGIGLCSVCARFSAMAASFIGGPLANVWAPLPSLIFGVFGTVVSILTLLLPETLNAKLHETIDELNMQVNSDSKPRKLNQIQSEQSEGPYFDIATHL